MDAGGCPRCSLDTVFGLVRSVLFDTVLFLLHNSIKGFT